MTDKTKRVLGMVCMLVNIVLPWMTSLLVVGIGGIIYGAVQRDSEPEARRFLRNGIIQIVLSFSSVFLALCSVFLFYFGLAGSQAVSHDSPLPLLLLLLIFPIFCPGLPLAMYIWSVFDAIKIYKHSQEAQA